LYSLNVIHSKILHLSTRFFYCLTLKEFNYTCCMMPHISSRCFGI